MRFMIICPSAVVMVSDEVRRVVDLAALLILRLLILGEFAEPDRDGDRPVVGAAVATEQVGDGTSADPALAGAEAGPGAQLEGAEPGVRGRRGDLRGCARTRPPRTGRPGFHRSASPASRGRCRGPPPSARRTAGIGLGPAPTRGSSGRPVIRRPRNGRRRPPRPGAASAPAMPVISPAAYTPATVLHWWSSTATKPSAPIRQPAAMGEFQPRREGVADTHRVGGEPAFGAGDR